MSGRLRRGSLRFWFEGWFDAALLDVEDGKRCGVETGSLWDAWMDECMGRWVVGRLALLNSIDDSPYVVITPIVIIAATITVHATLYLIQVLDTRSRSRSSIPLGFSVYATSHHPRQMQVRSEPQTIHN